MPSSKDMGNYTLKARLPSVPQSALVLLFANATPLLIDLTSECDLCPIKREWCYLHRGEFFGWLITVFMLTFSTRLVSLTPEPFKAISIIFSAVPGHDHDWGTHTESCVGNLCTDIAVIPNVLCRFFLQTRLESNNGKVFQLWPWRRKSGDAISKLAGLHDPLFWGITKIFLGKSPSQ